MRFHYHEPVTAGNKYRKVYYDGIQQLIEGRRKDVNHLRSEHCRKIRENASLHRKELIDLLGWPLDQYTSSVPDVRIEFVTESDGVRIERMQFEIFPGFFAYGILFRQPGDEPKPLVFSLHGGMGTPELCSGLLETGSDNYNAQTERLLSYGVHVFAPQLLIWDTATYIIEGISAANCDEMRRPIDTKMQLLDGSITALEILCMRQELDYFEKMPYVDPERFGIVGLSYGGYYTLYTAAIETRFKAALASCSFRDRFPDCKSDFAWKGAALKVQDAEAAMLICPRRCIIQVAKNDQLHPILESEEEAKRLLKLCGDDNAWLTYHVFNGVHETDPDDRDFELLMAALK